MDEVLELKDEKREVTEKHGLRETLSNLFSFLWKEDAGADDEDRRIEELAEVAPELAEEPKTAKEAEALKIAEEERRIAEAERAEAERAEEASGKGTMLDRIRVKPTGNNGGGGNSNRAGHGDITNNLDGPQSRDGRR